MGWLVEISIDVTSNYYNDIYDEQIIANLDLMFKSKEKIKNKEGTQ